MSLQLFESRYFDHTPGKYSSWRFAVELSPADLRNNDPLPGLVKLIGKKLNGAIHDSHLFTVLSELYNNALDHGVLKLDSAAKTNADGFAEYYEERLRRLSNLSDGWVTLEFSHEATVAGGRLTITVEDSGDGFLPHSTIPAPDNSQQHSGRGLSLLAAFCSELRVTGKGNTIFVALDWQGTTVQ